MWVPVSTGKGRCPERDHMTQEKDWEGTGRGGFRGVHRSGEVKALKVESSAFEAEGEGEPGPGSRNVVQGEVKIDLLSIGILDAFSDQR